VTAVAQVHDRIQLSQMLPSKEGDLLKSSRARCVVVPERKFPRVVAKVGRPAGVFFTNLTMHGELKGRKCLHSSIHFVNY
jgi:hypothetical protein